MEVPKLVGSRSVGVNANINNTPTDPTSSSSTTPTATKRTRKTSGNASYPSQLYKTTSTPHLNDPNNDQLSQELEEKYLLQLMQYRNIAWRYLLCYCLPLQQEILLKQLKLHQKREQERFEMERQKLLQKDHSSRNSSHLGVDSSSSNNSRTRGKRGTGGASSYATVFSSLFSSDDAGYDSENEKLSKMESLIQSWVSSSAYDLDGNENDSNTNNNNDVIKLGNELNQNSNSSNNSINKPKMTSNESNSESTNVLNDTESNRSDENKISNNNNSEESNEMNSNTNNKDTKLDFYHLQRINTRDLQSLFRQGRKKYDKLKQIYITQNQVVKCLGFLFVRLFVCFVLFCFFM